MRAPRFPLHLTVRCTEPSVTRNGARGKPRTSPPRECCCRVRIPCSPTPPWSSCSPWRQPQALVPNLLPRAGRADGRFDRPPETAVVCGRDRAGTISCRRHAPSLRSVRKPRSRRLSLRRPDRSPNSLDIRHSTNHRQSSACGPSRPGDVRISPVRSHTERIPFTHRHRDRDNVN